MCFWEKCYKTYDLDPVQFYFAPGLALFAVSKLTEKKSELLSNIDMLQIVQKGIRGGIFHAVLQHVKNNNKYLKNYDDKKYSSFFKCLNKISKFTENSIGKFGNNSDVTISSWKN